MMVACWYGWIRQFMIMSRRNQYRILGAINNVLSNGNHTNFPFCCYWLLYMIVIIRTMKQRNDNNELVCWSIMMSIYLLDLLSCPCPSVPLRIITTQLSQVYTYNWVVLLMFYMMMSWFVRPDDLEHGWQCKW